MHTNYYFNYIRTEAKITTRAKLVLEVNKDGQHGNSKQVKE